MKRTFLIIGHLVFAAILLTGCESASQSSEEQDIVPAHDKSKSVISESLGKALSSFNRGAGLLEQYQFTAAARAFEEVLEAAPDWTAARYNLGLAYLNMPALKII